VSSDAVVPPRRGGTSVPLDTRSTDMLRVPRQKRNVQVSTFLFCLDTLFYAKGVDLLEIQE